MSDITLVSQNNPFAGWPEFAKAIERPSPSDQRQVEDAVRAGFAENFSNERAGDGPPWASLQRSTVLDRIRNGYGGEHPILQRAGDLMRSYTDSGDGDAVTEFDQTGAGWSIAVGSGHDLSEIHDRGAPSRNIPARPAADLGNRQAENILTEIGSFLERQANEKLGR